MAIDSCGYRTLSEGPAEYDLCPVCGWEDDGSLPWECDGPNAISLVEAQQRFLKRATRLTRKRGRNPYPEEARDPGWRPIEVTDELLERVKVARAEFERELERDMREGDDHVEEFPAGFNADVQALEAQAKELTFQEVRDRYRAICTSHHFAFPEAELELMARLMHDRHWRARHPLQAVGWVWRHRRTATLWTRSWQVIHGTVRFAG